MSRARLSRARLSRARSASRDKSAAIAASASR
ncbi:hypothetical protein AB0J66_34035 [Actinoplanes sp. NPDC049598]